jgi:alpha-tubulin suppressor-like RCC1 family protein
MGTLAHRGTQCANEYCFLMTLPDDEPTPPGDESTATAGFDDAEEQSTAEHVTYDDGVDVDRIIANPNWSGGRQSEMVPTIAGVQQMKKILVVIAWAFAGACGDIQSPVAEMRAGGNGADARGEAPFIAFALSATERHVCAFAPGGNLQCWGNNSSGQLGNGTIGGVADAPVRVEGPAFEQVSVGAFHTCALTAEGQAYCWGNGSLGALGTGSTANTGSPAAVDTEVRFTSIGSGARFTCGLSTDSEAWCWGAAAQNQIGTAAPETCAIGASTQPCATRPVRVSGGHVFTRLEVGLWNGCGLTQQGSALCWGNNSFGQLGIGSKGQPSQPVAVSGGLAFRQLSVGAAHMCGVAADGQAYCWGANFYGNLGNGTSSESLTPSMVSGGHSFAAIRASDGNNILIHSCAIDESGTAYCWGANLEGKLGIASALPICSPPLGASPIFQQPCSTVPHPVETGLRFTAIELGNTATCAISTQRRAYCWGSNLLAQLGNASIETWTASPTPVSTWSKGGAARGGPAAPTVTGDSSE